MSIRDLIRRHEGHNLFCLSPWLPGEESPRSVFVSREMVDIVMGPWPDTRDGRRYSSLRALLDSFTQGDFITVAEDPFNKSSAAVVARVHPVDKEVWDFRCLDPKPGIRAFGCFSEIDTFIALTWDFRENLEGSEYWRAQVDRCRAEWSNLFGSLEPHRGNNINDYISYNFGAV